MLFRRDLQLDLPDLARETVLRQWSAVFAAGLGGDLKRTFKLSTEACFLQGFITEYVRKNPRRIDDTLRVKQQLLSYLIAEHGLNPDIVRNVVETAEEKLGTELAARIYNFGRDAYHVADDGYFLAVVRSLDERLTDHHPFPSVPALIDTLAAFLARRVQRMMRGELYRMEGQASATFRGVLVAETGMILIGLREVLASTELADRTLGMIILKSDRLLPQPDGNASPPQPPAQNVRIEEQRTFAAFKKAKEEDPWLRHLSLLAGAITHPELHQSAQKDPRGWVVSCRHLVDDLFEPYAETRRRFGLPVPDRARLLE